MRSTPALVAVGAVAALILVELLRMFVAANGQLIYSLDDPYIHLALAEQLLHGVYGVNPGEMAAPSSSILWPFLMAAFGAWEYAPLVVNVIAALGTTWLYGRIAQQLELSAVIQVAVVLILVVCTNVIGLVMTGMEHSVQVLITVALAYAIWQASRGEQLRWLPLLLIIAPLVRYELMAITVPSVMLLWWWGQRRAAMLAVVGTIVGVGGFSAFLVSIGMGALPTSIHVKSAVVESSGALHQLFLTFRENLKQRQAVVLLFAAVLSCLRPRNGLWLAVVGAVLLHLLVGQFGWFYRYEAYMLAWVASLLLLMYHRTLSEVVGSLNGWMTTMAAALLVLATGAPYLQGLIAVPGASANIYLQQYQMHRFVTGWWNDDVAVNDIGWVSYRNEHHVLDLWGLSSRKALQMRSQSRLQSQDSSLQWMDQLVQERNIRLVMLYEDWFGGVPEQWTLVGTLHMHRPRVTSTRDFISVYATQPAAVEHIAAALRAFRTSLPDGASLTVVGEE